MPPEKKRKLQYPEQKKIENQVFLRKEAHVKAEIESRT